MKVMKNYQSTHAKSAALPAQKRLKTRPRHGATLLQSAQNGIIGN
jgi:hypothetical protein